MTYKKYISTIGMSGVLGWIAWIVVVSKLSPYDSMMVALPLFFITFFIALTCTFAVAGFYFRIWLFKNEIFYHHVLVSLRQGILLSMIAVLCLIFQMLRVLSWWSGILLVVVAVLLEFYFSSKDAE